MLISVFKFKDTCIYGLHIRRICATFAAGLQMSLNAEENDNQPRLRKYFRGWQSRPYQDNSQCQRPESTAKCYYNVNFTCVSKMQCILSTV